MLDSTSALALESIPEHLLVVGGGIIGLEMATVYDALGSRVTVAELADQLIPGCDADLVEPLHRRIRKRYEGVHLSTRVSSSEARPDGIVVTFEGESAARVPRRSTRCSSPWGGRANGLELGLDQAGVEVDERGIVPVDGQLRTNVPTHLRDRRPRRRADARPQGDP